MENSIKRMFFFIESFPKSARNIVSRWTVYKHISKDIIFNGCYMYLSLSLPPQTSDHVKPVQTQGAKTPNSVS